MTQVMIFVPGLMGSELWDDAGKLWPGNAKDWAFGYSDEKFDRLCADDLATPDIVREAVGIVDIYGRWIDAFGSLRSQNDDAPLFVETGHKPTLIAVPYDWRKSIAVGAVAVANAVERAFALHGPTAELHLAAHSMGGLVSRYFLQSGLYDQIAGFDRIVSFLTFGTPHRGAVVALAAALGQHKADFLNSKQSRILANDPRFRGLYDLLPQPGSKPIWARGGKGRLVAHDVFDAQVAQAIGLDQASLGATRAIHDVLAQRWPKLRTFLFVGSRFETMTHALWNGGANAAIVKSKDGGDGTVNLQGAIMEQQQIRLTDRNHMTLIAATETREALQDLFDAQGLLLAAEATVELTPAELFVASGQPIEIALSIKGPGANVHGKLYLERARIPKDAEVLTESDFHGADAGAARELRYDGPDLSMLKVRFDGVSGPAALRPVFETFDPVPRRFIGPTFLVTVAD